MSAFWKAAEEITGTLVKESDAPPVPHARQATPYYCGVAVVKSITDAAGYRISQDRLAQALKTTPAKGTHPLSILRVLKSMHIQAGLHRNMTFEQLQSYLDKSFIVILLIQDHAEPGTDYSKAWEDGHYVFAVGHDGDEIRLQDPAKDEDDGKRIITRKQLMERWHDQAPDGEKFIQSGIIVSPHRRRTYKKLSDMYWAFKMPKAPEIPKLRTLKRKKDRPAKPETDFKTCPHCGYLFGSIPGIEDDDDYDECPNCDDKVKGKTDAEPEPEEEEDTSEEDLHRDR